MKRILVISPHPDDEAIGCGGTLRKHVIEGDSVRVFFLTSGEAGGHGIPEPSRTREAEALAAAEILGVDRVEFWREQDGSLRASSRMVDRLRTELEAWRPHVLYTPHQREMHPDHRAAVRLVKRALAGNGRLGRRPIVLMYTVWTPAQRIDDLVDITPYVETKAAAVRAYESQCRVMRFDHAILGLDRYRGEMYGWPGCDYAETFERLEV
jgi:LmbE family N-acetylglucosaminyl deacetylase